MLILALTVAGQPLHLERTNGPGGGIATALETAPDGTLYAAGWGKELVAPYRLPLNAPLYHKSSGDSTWHWVADFDGGVRSLVSSGAGGILVGTYKGLYHSTVGSMRWQRVSADTLVIADLALSDDTVFAATQAGLYRYSMTSGAWEPVAFEGQAVGHVAARGTAVAVGLQGKVFRSDDNGATWAQAGTSPDGALSGLVLRQDGTMYFSAAREVIRIPPDAPQEPTSFAVGENVSIAVLESAADGGLYVGTGISCSPFGCGGRAGLYRSIDGGATWTSLGLEQFSVTDVAQDAHGQLHAVAVPYLNFVNPGGIRASPGILRLEEEQGLWLPASQGMAVSQVRSLAVRPDGALIAATGLSIEVSEDRGETWHFVLPIYLGGVDPSRLAVCPDGTVYTIKSEHLLRSVDLQQWASIPLPTIPEPWSVRLFCTSKGSLFLDGRHTLLRSRDRGETWQTLEAEDLKPGGVVIAAPDGHLFARRSSDRTAHFESADEGDSWRPVYVWESTYGYVVAAGSADLLFSIKDIPGPLAASYRLHREGSSGWRAERVDLPDTPRAVAMSPRGDVFAGYWTAPGRELPPLHLCPSCTAWEPIDTSPSFPTINGFEIDAHGYLYAATEGSGVYRSRQPLATAIDPGPSRPASLHAEVYPQPAGRLATFNFTLPSPTPTTLSLFDLLGRRVAIVLDDVVLAAGSHEATWSLAGLAAGVYVYQLKAGDAVTTGRLVIAL